MNKSTTKKKVKIIEMEWKLILSLNKFVRKIIDNKTFKTLEKSTIDKLIFRVNIKEMAQKKKKMKRKK